MNPKSAPTRGVDATVSTPTCERCNGVHDHDTEECCSSHRKHLCHACYRRTHFVERCNCARPKCVAERTPVPTPPPSNPAPSLRPVEEPDLAALVRWVQSLPTAAAEAAAAEFIAPLLARLRAAEETLARATSLDTLFDVLLEAQYGGMRPGGEEREAVAQLAEAVQPLLRAALAEGASR